jgi:hypothetical protein
VIIEVFVTERQPINALPCQFFDRMLDLVRSAMIGEAGSELFADLPLRLDLFEQEHTAVGCNRAAIKLGHHLPRCGRLETRAFHFYTLSAFVCSFWWE